jgi:putative heme-binding domain-containing protein
MSIPEPIKQHLDLKSGTDRGRIYDLVYQGARRRARPRLSTASSAELVKLLSDADAWWRETAQRLLYEYTYVGAKIAGAVPVNHEKAEEPAIDRGPRSLVAALSQVVGERPTALGRMHALWTLQLLRALDTDSIVLGLTDPEPRVREQTIKLAESRLEREPLLVSKLVPLADDPDPMVRFQLAFSLGEAGAFPRAIDALAAIAVRDSGSPWTRTAVLSSLAGRSAAFLDALAKRDGFLGSAAGREWLDELAVLIGAERKPDQVREALERLSAAGAASDTMMRAVLGIGRGLERAGGSFRVLLEKMGQFKIEPLLAQAGTVAESDAPAEARVVAIRLLALANSTGAHALFQRLLDARQPAAVQLAALQGFAAAVDRVTARQVIERWKSMSPAVRREAIEVLFGRKVGTETVLSAIESRELPVAEIDPARLQRLVAGPDPALSARVKRILAAESPAGRDRAQVVRGFQPALALAGDRDRGREVFVKVCATCHQAEGRGIDVGPNLATVAGRSPDDLLLHILDPNREVAPNFVNYSVATESGRVLSGIIAEESATAVVLKRAEGATDVVPRNQIQEITSTGVSLMPEGLEKGLSVEDVANLIAFVRSIRPTDLGPAPVVK